MSKMRRNLTSVFVFLLLLTFGYSVFASSEINEFHGSMNCVIKYNQIQTMNEGKPKFYNGVENRFEVGDTLSFSYTLNTIKHPNRDKFKQLSFSFEDELRDSTLIGAFANNADYDKKTDLYVGYFGGIKGWYMSKGLGTPQMTVLEMSRDSFYLRDDGRNGKLLLNRYYKGDYQGIFTTRGLLSLSFFSNQTVLLDCRTDKDAIEEIMAEFEE